MPASLAMERLNALSALETPGPDLNSEKRYQVLHERLHDTIYFELRTLVSYGQQSQTYKRIITGQIREFDLTTTVVEGDFHRARAVPHASPVTAALCAVTALALAQTGEFSTSCLVMLLLAAVLIMVWPLLVNYRAIDRTPTLERIELAIQPRAEDRNLIAQRKQQHLAQLKEEIGNVVAPTMTKPDDVIQARG